MAPPLDALLELEGRGLPGATIAVEPHESQIADHAIRAADGDRRLAHPIWFVIASLRGMGITVGELCELARKAPDDTLLYGGVEIEQDRPLRPGGSYRTTAEVTDVTRKTTRDGSTLDSLSVVVRVFDAAEPCGRITSTYLFKRGGTS